jgi:hypothetical protein
MPKDTSSVVLGMLSDAGSRTRPALASVETPAPDPPPAGDPAPPPPTAPPAAPVTAAPKPEAHTQEPGEEAVAAPRTLRLRPDTAARLRTAWMTAKRNDVLLTAQDFASDLVDHVLKNQRKPRTRG